MIIVIIAALPANARYLLVLYAACAGEFAGRHTIRPIAAGSGQLPAASVCQVWPMTHASDAHCISCLPAPRKPLEQVFLLDLPGLFQVLCSLFALSSQRCAVWTAHSQHHVPQHVSIDFLVYCNFEGFHLVWHQCIACHKMIDQYS